MLTKRENLVFCRSASGMGKSSLRRVGQEFRMDEARNICRILCAKSPGKWHSGNMRIEERT